MVLMVCIGQIRSQIVNIESSQSLENGLSISKYSLEHTVPVHDETVCDRAILNMEVDWPESASQYNKELLFLSKLAVLKLLNSSRNYGSPIDIMEVSIKNILMEETPNIFTDYGNCPEIIEINITVNVNGKLTYITKMDSRQYCMMSSHITTENMVFTNTGQVLDNSWLPAFEKVKGLIFKYLTNFQEPVENIKDFDYLSYPEIFPEITPEFIIFSWPLESWQYLEAKIPLKEFKAYVSPQLLQYLP